MNAQGDPRSDGRGVGRREMGDGRGEMGDGRWDWGDGSGGQQEKNCGSTLLFISI